MSIAYLDPGNIESDLQAGAVVEYKVRNTTCDETISVEALVWRLLGLPDLLRYPCHVIYTHKCIDAFYVFQLSPIALCVQ